MRWFQTSGTPGRHQWLQSCFLDDTFLPSKLILPYIEGCPSLRKLVSFVTFRRITGTCISLMASSTIFIFKGQESRIEPFFTGSFSPLHDPPESHSPPLYKTKPNYKLMVSFGFSFCKNKLKTRTEDQTVNQIASP